MQATAGPLTGRTTCEQGSKKGKTMTMTKHAVCAALGIALFAGPVAAEEGATIKAIKERGELVCGTSTGTAIGLDRKSAVEGESVYVLVDLGGADTIKKKKKKNS